MATARSRTARSRAEGGRVLIVTGAGVSADSGVPTFRGSGGIWRERDALSLATPEAFERDPETVLEWYCERRRNVSAAQPNAGHLALAALSRLSGEHLLLTQNVDDLHERAGAVPARTVHVHGDLFTDRCSRCVFATRSEAPFDPPGECPRCGARLRPGVVWFGEQLDPRDVRRVETFLHEGPCDLVVTVGTTAAFRYIIDWVERAVRSGAWHVDVNPEPNPLGEAADEAHRGRGAEVLPRLFPQ